MGKMILTNEGHKLEGLGVVGTVCVGRVFFCTGGSCKLARACCVAVYGRVCGTGCSRMVWY